MFASSLRRFVVLPALVVALMVGIASMAAPGASALERNYVAPGGGVYEQVGADLVISNVSESYSRYGGWYTAVTVRNQGNGAAAASYVGFNNSYQSLSALNVGSSATVYFFRGSYCEVSGTLKADAFNQVYELNESNNSRLWTLIC